MVTARNYKYFVFVYEWFGKNANRFAYVIKFFRIITGFQKVRQEKEIKAQKLVK